jgi:hypothetical protein
MNRIILLKLCRLLRLPHQNQDGRGTTEQRVAAALVGLPCGDEMAEALLEELFVDLDLCHGSCRDVVMAEMWMVLSEG